AALAVLAWAGRDTVAIGEAPSGREEDAGGLFGDLPIDGLPGLGDSGASVGFQVNTGASLAGGLLWVLAVLVIALLVSRRTPLPPGWEAVHRVVRPAVS